MEPDARALRVVGNRDGQGAAECIGGTIERDGTSPIDPEDRARRAATAARAAGPLRRSGAHRRRARGRPRRARSRRDAVRAGRLALRRQRRRDGARRPVERGLRARPERALRADGRAGPGSRARVRHHPQPPGPATASSWPSDRPCRSSAHFTARTDTDPLAGAIRSHSRRADSSRSPRRNGAFVPDGNWIATIHHGLDFSGVAAGNGSGGYLAFVGRLSPDKGVASPRSSWRAVRAGRCASRPRRSTRSRTRSTTSIVPAIADGVVEFLGELGEVDRDRLDGRSACDGHAQSLAGAVRPCRDRVTRDWERRSSPADPARCRRSWSKVSTASSSTTAAAGAAAVIRVAQLDRARIRARALERFSAARMLDEYERSTRAWPS